MSCLIFAADREGLDLKEAFDENPSIREGAAHDWRRTDEIPRDRAGSSAIHRKAKGGRSAFYEQSVRNCLDVLRECGSQEDREQALELLSKLGTLQ